MKVSELIEKLQDIDPDTLVLFYDNYRSWVELRDRDLKVVKPVKPNKQQEGAEQFLMIRHR